ncbi:MAG TPA: hypothetical protein VME40_11480, partial [Caulobacteraceae bacterium]|nr:hypothetical protein [Caulobacteraceae bacterium]
MAQAAEFYVRRADAGGDWDSWHSRLQAARCRRELGDSAQFLRLALEAFNQRPSRAEPLYDLARFYRERSMYGASWLFCEAGFAIPHPGPNAPYLEPYVYDAGLLEEYSIAAN